MTRVGGGRSLAALAVTAALALGACGGDDEGGNATTGATAPDTTATTDTGTTETGTTGTTENGTTGTTERERTETTREDRTTTRERGRKRRGRGRSGSNGGSGGSQQAQPGDVRKVARTVCSQFLPHIIARDLQRGKTSEEKVARDYAKAFPDRQEKRAYDGCLQGLKDRQN